MGSGKSVKVTRSLITEQTARRCPSEGPAAQSAEKLAQGQLAEAGKGAGV